MDTRRQSFRLRGAAVAVVALLVVVVAEGWLPRLVPSGPASSDETLSDVAGGEGIDGALVAEAADHRVTGAPGGGGGLVVSDRSYRTRFDHRGFSFRPTGAAEALGVSLASITRTSGPVIVSPGAWTGTANVAERRLGPGITERVTARAGEVEWDVVLDAPPEGTGPLVVTGTLTGVLGGSRADGSAAGVTLTDGTPVRLGAVVVRDATGTTLHRGLPVVTGGEVRLAVPAAALAGARYPVTIDPTISGSTPVDGPGWQYDPDVAFDGTNYFVVWRDNRGAGEDIFGARVRPDGTLLDPSGIAIATDSRNQFQPHVAWNGSVFLVVWEHRHSDSDPDIRAKRVSSSGALVATTPADTGIPVSVYFHRETFPDVAASGSDFLVVWEDDRTAGNNVDIYGARVTTAGDVRDPGLPIATGTNANTDPSVAWNGATWLVAWTHWYTSTDPDIHATLVDANGASVPGAGGFVIASPTSRQYDSQVGSDGSQFLVVWNDERNYFNDELDVYGSRVRSDGLVLDFNGFRVSGGDGYQERDYVAYNGVFLVVGPGSTGLEAVRVQSDGTVLDTPPITVSSDAGIGWPGVTRGPGDDWGVVYTNGGGPTGTLFLRRFSAK